MTVFLCWEFISKPVDSPHKGPLTWEVFHSVMSFDVCFILMTAKCWFIHSINMTFIAMCVACTQPIWATIMDVNLTWQLIQYVHDFRHIDYIRKCFTFHLHKCTLMSIDQSYHDIEVITDNWRSIKAHKISVMILNKVTWSAKNKTN